MYQPFCGRTTLLYNFDNNFCIDQNGYMCIIQLESTYRSHKIGQVVESNFPSIYLPLLYSLNPTPTRKVDKNVICASKYDIIMVL